MRSSGLLTDRFDCKDYFLTSDQMLLKIEEHNPSDMDIAFEVSHTHKELVSIMGPVLDRAADHSRVDSFHKDSFLDGRIKP